MSARRLTALLAPCLLLTGCLAEVGETCALNSDCEAGLICGLDGVCATPAAVQDALNLPPTGAPDVAETPDAPPPAETVGADAGGDIAAPECAASAGIFEAQSAGATCAEPAQKLVVNHLAIVASPSGLGKIADLANPVVAEGFETGSSSLEAWVDGTWSPDCVSTVAWVTGPEDRNDDCTADYAEVFAFRIPAPIGDGIVQVEQPVYDIAAGQITGVVQEAVLLAAIADSLEQTADDIVEPDLDTDGDQVPDMLSVTLSIGFAQ